jgi:hypothetical protein
VKSSSATPKKVADIKDGADAYEHLKDSMGRFRTQSLFWEKRHTKYPAPFTLKDKDHKGRISMYRKYMEIGDPTEYRTALALLGSWRHWQALTSSDWFAEFIERWRAELQTKFESDRFQQMLDLEVSHKGTPLGAKATTWLAERYAQEKKPKRGRPSNAEKAKHLKTISEEDKLLNEEAQRLGL